MLSSIRLEFASCPAHHPPLPLKPGPIHQTAQKANFFLLIFALPATGRTCRFSGRAALHQEASSASTAMHGEGSRLGQLPRVKADVYLSFFLLLFATQSESLRLVEQLLQLSRLSTAPWVDGVPLVSPINGGSDANAADVSCAVARDFITANSISAAPIEVSMRLLMFATRLSPTNASASAWLQMANWCYDRGRNSVSVLLPIPLRTSHPLSTRRPPPPLPSPSSASTFVLSLYYCFRPSSYFLPAFYSSSSSNVVHLLSVCVCAFV